MSNQAKPPHLLDEFTPEQIAELAPHEREAFELLNSVAWLSEEDWKQDALKAQALYSNRPRSRIHLHYFDLEDPK